MQQREHPDQQFTGMSRRHFLGSAAAGVGLTVGAIPLLEASEKRKKIEGTMPRVQKEMQKVADAVLMLWLEGGPGNDDLWNPSKAGADFRGPFEPIQTSIPGYQMTELFPKTAQNMDKIAVVNSLYVSTSDHFRSSEEILRPDGKTTLATEIGQKKMAGGIPDPFFWLKGQYQPDDAHKVDQQFRFNDDGNGKFERPPLPTADVERLRDRSELLKNIEKSSRFSINTQHLTPNEIQYAESRSSGINLFLSGGELMSSLNIPKDMEEDFGKNPLGRATASALRFLESGSGFATVHHSMENGWDRHDNVARFKPLAEPLDHIIATTIRYMREGRFKRNIVVVCMGEFARTPKTNSTGGRDHWAQGFGALFFGHGVKGKQVIGAAQKGAISDRPIAAEWTVGNTIRKIVGMPIPEAAPKRFIEEVVDV
ncbi:MAG TPA: DUF1501 domain-containing protein [Candidatus Peribacterales bacterium]|nr:DUF1501 domain-containing protein [Candidatus Peribacterales bacterium]